MNINDKMLASKIVELLTNNSTKIDYVLELVCSELVESDEQLTNKLHIAISKATTKLLEYKQKRIDLGMNIIPFAYAKQQMHKLKPETRISYMLDMCNCVFPDGQLKSYSELSRRIYVDTINCLKEVIIANNIKCLDELFKDDWYMRRADYIKLLTVNNELFKD